MAIDTAGRAARTSRAHSVCRSSTSRASTRPTAVQDKSFRGLGIDEGLRILSRGEVPVGVPVLTDVHDEDDIAPAAAVVDVLQTPAFLCRQTDFIRACAVSGKPVNIKKGQFLAPGDMKNVIDKARDAAREGGPERRPLPGVRARRVLRLQQSRFRHALAGDHARDRRAGRVRRDALGAAAGRAGHVERRPARVRAGAGARGGGGRCRGALHGDASRIRPRRRATGPMRCRSIACGSCSRRCSSSTASPRSAAFSKPISTERRRPTCRLPTSSSR